MTELTIQQLNSAHSPAPNTVTVAAAGSGKTKTLVERVRWLLQSCLLSEICVVTFTNAAAREMRERINAICHDQMQPFTIGHCGTLHALMFRILREHGHLIGLPGELGIMTEEEAEEALLSISRLLKVKAPMSTFLEAVEMQLSKRGQNPDLKANLVAKEFIRQMRQRGELTYDAILHLGHELLLTHKPALGFKHLLVDEFQDSCIADARIYRLLDVQTRFYVGDDAQSIYGFRGSDVNIFREEAEGDENTAFHRLSINYRSAYSIVAASERLAAKMADKLQNPIFPRNQAEEGAVEVIQYGTPGEEVLKVSDAIRCRLAIDQTVAVLFRTNRAASAFKQQLVALGHEFPEEKRTGDGERLGFALLRAMAQPQNDRALLSYIGQAVRNSFTVPALQRDAALKMTSVSAMFGLSCNFTAFANAEAVAATGQEFLALVHQRTPAPDREALTAAGVAIGKWCERVTFPCTFADLLMVAAAKEEPPAAARLHVGTIHSAKGLEWDAVYLPACEDEVMPGKKTGAEYEEERRCFYVALTRARTAVSISWCVERMDDYQTWKKVKRTPCRFIAEALPPGGVA